MAKKSNSGYDPGKQSCVDFFALRGNQDQVISPSDFYSRVGKTRQWFSKCVGKVFFAQTALAANQHASLKVKNYYEQMMSKGLEGFDTETVLEVSAAISPDGKGHDYLITKDMIVETISKIGAPGKKGGLGAVNERGKVRGIDYVSEVEARIKKVHDEYVMAPLGSTPSIADLVREHGKGKIEIEAVRKIAVEEGWKGERASYLHRALDLVPEEVKLVTMMRTVEVHKLLYTHIKVLSKIHLDYYKTGQAKSLDGRHLPKFTPDPGAISGLAESMRRLVDGSSSVNIMINNGGKGPQVDQMAIAEPTNSAQSRFLNKLNEMSAEELEGEIENLTKLRHLIDKSDNRVIEADYEMSEADPKK